MRPTTVLIVDDEPLARSGLRRLVERRGGGTVVGESADGAAAARDQVALRPDVVLLDVQMPEMDGFAALRAAAEELPALPVVVFITAYDRFAIEAFRVQALDYLVKPFTDERFVAALGRACAAVHTAEESELGRRVVRLLGAVPAAAPAPRLLVRLADRVLSLAPGELEGVGADSYYAVLHVRGASHLLRESLTSLETRLDPERFVRVHRSAIVNVDFVRAVGRADVELADGTRVPVARDRRRFLLAQLEKRE